MLYVANVGDTRAVLSKSGQAERMSVDDKCDNIDEQIRIKQSNGLIVMNRVGGVLAVTRAFGDHSLKDSGLIAIPHIVKYTLKPFDKFLVIASGLSMRPHRSPQTPDAAGLALRGNWVGVAQR